MIINRLTYLISLLVIFSCNSNKNPKSKLDYIAFQVSVETMIDSMRTATVLLDKMDFGNGATCFVVDGKLHYSRKEKGFNIVDMPADNSSTTPIIEPLNQTNSKRLFELISFLDKYGIRSIVKSYDGLNSFAYNQKDLNPYNEFKQSRTIVYIKEAKDTCSKLFNRMVVLDRYKNILLLAPKTYNSNSDHSKTNQAGNKKSTDIEEKKIDPQKVKISNPNMSTHQQIYSESESRRDYSLHLLSDTATLTKNYSEKIGNNERKIIFYYQQKRIIAIVHRIFNERGEKIAFKTFDFDENNNCNLFSIYENREIGERTYALLNDFLVITDSKYNSIALKSSQKQQIMQSAKASLDSIMQHFPEFKYSINWK